MSNHSQTMSLRQPPTSHGHRGISVPPSRTRAKRYCSGRLLVAWLLSLAATGMLHAQKADFQLREIRSIDGRGNNAEHPDWGAAEIELLRLTTVDYADGTETPSGESRPSARAISNAVVAQAASIPNAAGVTDFVWQWGQFLDHDIDETPLIDPAEPFNISVPAGDPYFDPTGTGTLVIRLSRSYYNIVDGVRQQFNAITAYIDASNVYGSDAERNRALRTLDGTGRLKTSAGNLLPFNTAGLPNAPSGEIATLFLAGDVRANEQIGLTAMHTLFVREHNYWADRFAEMLGGDGADRPSDGGHQHEAIRSFAHNRRPSGDRIYELARAMVVAEMQIITYRDFLPLLLGRGAVAPYRGYDRETPADISNAFATAAYRFGHSMLSPTLLRLDENLDEIAGGHIALASAFFAPNEIIAHGIDPILRGLSQQRAQEVDNFVIDDVRNFLFGPPGSGGFDLASLNIQRGRDHGLPSYNQTRRDYFLAPAGSFADISEKADVQAALASVYASVEDVDLWVGGLAEDHAPGALVGETFQTILAEQFRSIRDGDRFWYSEYLPRELRQLAERQTLATIIRRNTDIGRELPDNVFVLGGPTPDDGDARPDPGDGDRPHDAKPPRRPPTILRRPGSGPTDGGFRTF